MRRNGVLETALSEIPNLDGIVFTTGNEMKAVRRPANSDDTFEMAFKKHYTAAGSQIPNTAETIATSRCN